MTEFAVSSVAILLGALFVAAIIVAYFIPAIIAFRRQHPHRWLILALCIFLGSTIVFWIVALVWALNAPRLPDGDGEANAGGSGVNLLANDLKRVFVRETPDRASPDFARNQTSSIDDVLRQIERLEKMRAAGRISDGEFETLKAAAMARL